MKSYLSEFRLVFQTKYLLIPWYSLNDSNSFGLPICTAVHLYRGNFHGMLEYIQSKKTVTEFHIATGDS